MQLTAAQYLNTSITIVGIGVTTNVLFCGCLVRLIKLRTREGRTFSLLMLNNVTADIISYAPVLVFSGYYGEPVPDDLAKWVIAFTSFARQYQRFSLLGLMYTRLKMIRDTLTYTQNRQYERKTYSPRLVSGATVILSGLAALLASTLNGTDYSVRHMSFIDQDGKTVVYASLFTGGFMGTLAVATGVFILIIYYSKHTYSGLKRLDPNNIAARMTKDMAYMSLGLAVCFLVSYVLPLLFVVLFGLDYIHIVALLLLTTPILNVLIYFMFGQHYRDQVTETLCNTCCKKKSAETETHVSEVGNIAPAPPVFRGPMAPSRYFQRIRYGRVP